MTRSRVVVTGMGALTPIGNTVEETWKNALEGVSGVSQIDSFDTKDHRVKIGARVKNFNVEEHFKSKLAKRYDEFIQLGYASAAQAIEQSGIHLCADLSNFGVAFGSGIGGIRMICSQHQVLLDKGPRRVSPFFVPSSIVNMIAGQVSIDYGLGGPNISIVTACTTGCHNIGVGVRMIQCGDATGMVVGGAEWSTCPLSVAGFASMKALSTRNDEPERASRPWDRARDGFVLGDGAGCLVIESYEHAIGRGAEILAEIIGFGMSADAHHITGPPEDGKGAIAAMQRALADAELAPEQIDYINAHGTSTPLGDIAETKAIKSVFGSDTSIPINSTKSMFGHLLGAAGAVEAIISIQTIREQRAHPTINLEDPDEDCDLDFMPLEARDIPAKYSLSNSFGFGGTNGTLIFRAV